jgi:hypothetical protein
MKGLKQTINKLNRVLLVTVTEFYRTKCPIDLLLIYEYFVSPSEF